MKHCAYFTVVSHLSQHMTDVYLLHTWHTWWSNKHKANYENWQF